MLIPTIEFDLKNQRFVVEDTDDNLMLIEAHPLTRRIVFGEMFDFQYIKASRQEPKFIDFGITVLDALDQLNFSDDDGVDYGDVMA